MKYVVIWKDQVEPSILNEETWEDNYCLIKQSKDVVAVHVYGEDGCWDCDVNLEMR